MKEKGKSGGFIPPNQSRFRKSPPPYEIYEQMKAALPPDLTAAEYIAACQRIARLLGI